MNKNTIVQFVCFVTNLDEEKFMVKWEHYAAQYKGANSGLQKAITENNKHKYDYVSRHVCNTENFRLIS
jgi:hypothetical protein